jgi:N-acetylneuraminic acid mutarotase
MGDQASDADSRNHPAAGTVNGKIYVIGGRLSAANVANMLSSATDVVEEYDPATDKWRVMTKMPYATSGEGWTTFQGRIYVAGGELRDAHMDAVFRDFVVFDPAINDWYRLPSMPTARHGVVLAALGNRIHAGRHTSFIGNGGERSNTGVNEVFEFGVQTVTTPRDGSQVLRFWWFSGSSVVPGLRCSGSRSRGSGPGRSRLRGRVQR